MSQTEEKLSLNGWSPLTPNHLKEIREAASGINYVAVSMWLFQIWLLPDFSHHNNQTGRNKIIYKQSKNNRSNQEISISPIWKQNIIEERKEKEKIN